jgi:thioredoxin-like negative regulator of GroEL
MRYQPRVQYVAKRHERMAADTVMRLLGVLDATDTDRDTRIRARILNTAEMVYETDELVLTSRPR